MAGKSKMERFTPRARHVLTVSQEEAEGLGHRYIGPEHILLGLLRVDGGIGGQVLRKLGLRLPQVGELVERLGETQSQSTGSELLLTADTRRTLELAVEEARRMGNRYIGTEHFLLAIASQSNCRAVEILEKLGIAPEQVRSEVERALRDEAGQADEGPAAPPPGSAPIERVELTIHFAQGDPLTFESAEAREAIAFLLAQVDDPQAVLRHLAPEDRADREG